MKDFIKEWFNNLTRAFIYILLIVGPGALVGALTASRGLGALVTLVSMATFLFTAHKREMRKRGWE